MEKKFADVVYVEHDIPVSSIVESGSQPTNRNDMSDPRRQKLLASIERDGQKDRIDVVQLEDGTYQVFEGHGRVLAASVLGMETIAAKVFQTRDAAEIDRVRRAVFEANDTVMKMTGAQWAQYIYREGRNKDLDVRALSKAVDLVDFIQTHMPDVADEYILVKNVGPDALAAARRAVREILGLGGRGAMPQDTISYVVKTFRWVVKHGMTRPVIDWFKEDKGHAEVRKCIENDTPLPSPRRGRRSAAEIEEAVPITEG
jgi:hypothetical protein